MLAIFLNFLPFHKNKLSGTKVLKFNLLANIFRDFWHHGTYIFKKNKEAWQRRKFEQYT